MRTTTLVSLFFFGVFQVQGRNHHVVYDCTQTPGICKNFCFAVNCLGHPETLNGGGNGPANRQAWGDGTVGATQLRKAPPVADDTIEEYPYASSLQGGISFNNIPVCLRTVPKREQSKQGRLLQGIGQSPKTDTWTTELTNVAAANLGVTWCYRTTQCTPDAEQFVPSAKGAFTANPQATTAQNMRRDLAGDGSGDGGKISKAFAEYLENNQEMAPDGKTARATDAHGNCYTRPLDLSTNWAATPSKRRRGLDSFLQRRNQRQAVPAASRWSLANTCWLPTSKANPVAAKPNPVAAKPNTLSKTNPPTGIEALPKKNDLSRTNSLPVGNAQAKPNGLSRTNSLPVGNVQAKPNGLSRTNSLPVGNAQAKANSLGKP
ncbi:hypothetical protein ACKVV1_005806 [Pyricularia oryzae]